MNSVKQTVPLHLCVFEKNSSNQSSVLRRILWMGIFFTCVSIMSLQVYDRVSYYNQVPLSTNVKYVKNRTMEMPHVTICPAHYKRVDIERKMMNNLKVRLNTNVTSFDLLTTVSNLTELWDTLAYKLNDIVKMCYFRGLKCDGRDDNWKLLRSVKGNCFTFVPSGPLTGSGIYQGLQLLFHNVVNRSSNQPISWKLFLHSSRDDPTWDTFTKGVSVYHPFVFDIRIRAKKFYLLNTSREPCSRITTSKCAANFLSNSLLRNVGCRLPFMPDLYGKLCSTPSEFESADKFVDKHLLDTTSEVVCQQECEQIIFEANVDSTQYIDQTTTRVRIFYDQFIYDEMREEHLYSLVAMLCDIGGSLGLFLGASVLTFVQVVEMIIRGLKEKYKK